MNYDWFLAINNLKSKTCPTSVLNKYMRISTTHHYNTRLSAKECFSVKFSRTEKMRKSFTKIGVSIWSFIPHSVKKSSTYIVFVIKILYNEDDYSNVKCLMDYFKKFTWYAI